MHKSMMRSGFIFLALALAFGVTLERAHVRRGTEALSFQHQVEPQEMRWSGGPPEAQAADIYLGRITSTGTEVTNGTTAVPFAIPFVQKLTVQCDGIGFFLLDTASSVTTSNGVKVTAGPQWTTSVNTNDNSPTHITVAGTSSAVMRFISASGTVNCNVYRAYGDEPAGRGL